MSTLPAQHSDRLASERSRDMGDLPLVPALPPTLALWPNSEKHISMHVKALRQGFGDVLADGSPAVEDV